MKTVLVTGIGGDVAQSVATIIKEKWPEFRIIGIDVHSQHGGSLFVDEFLTVLPAKTPNYIESVLKLIEEYQVDILLPTTEPELSVWVKMLGKLDRIVCITPGFSAINNGLDKFATIQALKKINLPTPWTRLVSEGLPPAYPCILKSRFGSGSRSVFVVQDSAEASYLAGRYPHAIFQEKLEPLDCEVTCGVYRTLDNRVSSVLLLRRLAGGFTGWARVIEHPETSCMCETIANRLNLRGSMNIQLVITESGPRVFEINPRFSSTVLMRHKLGFQDVVWVFEELLGNKVSFPVIQSGQVAVRTHDSVILGD